MDDQVPGVAQQLHPLVRRVLAPNPSAFTYTGTQSYIVGRGRVAVIDPGPNREAHREALIAAIGDDEVVAIACTHTHLDHSPGAAPLAARTGGRVIGCSPLNILDDGPRADAGFDPTYRPERVLADGERIEGDGWTLEAVATPGHTSNHLCYALPQAGALFSGDHVMGWSTTVIAPPDGDMAAYMASMDKCLARDDRVYFPAHGDPIEAPQRMVRAQAAHRRQREGQILRLLGEGIGVIPAMVERMYAGVARELHPAAGRSVMSHLIDLRARGRVVQDGAEWRLAA